LGNGLALDIRAGIRALLASRAISAAAALTLALAMGAITALFSVANGLMLRPLPVSDPQRLVTITSETALRFGFQAGAGWSYAMWERLRERGAAFDGAFAWILQPLDLAQTGESQPLEPVCER
jgi:putative ABC transport system permease protein